MLLLRRQRLTAALVHIDVQSPSTPRVGPSYSIADAHCSLSYLSPSDCSPHLRLLISAEPPDRPAPATACLRHAAQQVCLWPPDTRVIVIGPAGSDVAVRYVAAAMRAWPRWYR